MFRIASWDGGERHSSGRCRIIQFNIACRQFICVRRVHVPFARRTTTENAREPVRLIVFVVGLEPPKMRLDAVRFNFEVTQPTAGRFERLPAPFGFRRAGGHGVAGASYEERVGTCRGRFCSGV